MKYILVLFLFISPNLKAQKFALLDERFTEPVTYTNIISAADKISHLFPVEKKRLPEFIKVLEQIEKDLSSKSILKRVSDYEVGCIKFTGHLISLAREQRIDYVITSTCDNIKIDMHLTDAKTSNANNAFFIHTWIKYIEQHSN
jgi:hypothetical protein